MITENLSTLKINKLTQAQYNRELEAGRLDPNAIYLIPDDAGNNGGGSGNIPAMDSIVAEVLAALPTWTGGSY